MLPRRRIPAPATSDVLLGHLGIPGIDPPITCGCRRPQFEYWKHTHLTIDVVPGRGAASRWRPPKESGSSSAPACSPRKSWPRRAVLARGNDPPDPPRALRAPLAYFAGTVLARGATPWNPPLRSAPRCGTSPAHRPLTGPKGPVRWAGSDRLAVTSRRQCPPAAPAAHPGLRPGVAGPVTITSPEPALTMVGVAFRDMPRKTDGDQGKHGAGRAHPGRWPAPLDTYRRGMSGPVGPAARRSVARVPEADPGFRVFALGRSVQSPRSPSTRKFSAQFRTGSNPVAGAFP